MPKINQAIDKEKLIEEVRRHPYMYDASEAKYADSNKREQTWKSIARELSTSESECKKAWSNLRESFRRAIAKKHSKNGTSTKKWQFEDEMSFLLPHMKQRKTISSLTDDDSDTENVSENNELLSNHNNSPMSSNEPAHKITKRRESSCSTNTSTNSYPNRPKKKRFKKTQDCSSVSEEILKYLLKEKETNKDDEIDKFFSSMAITVKKLNPYNQSLLKSRIFNMVSEFELKELQEKSGFYAGSSDYKIEQ